MSKERTTHAVFPFHTTANVQPAGRKEHARPEHPLLRGICVNTPQRLRRRLVYDIGAVEAHGPA